MNKDITIGEKYGPAMEIKAQAEADAYFEQCVEHCMSAFWDDEEYVIEYHVPRSEWINEHPGCLHLWCPKDTEIPRPPSIMVGFNEEAK
jgi:hypothetical protein